MPLRGQECACPEYALGPGASDRLEGVLLPTLPSPLTPQLFSHPLVMVRGLWALALEGPYPPGWAGILVACLPILTTLLAGAPLCVVMSFLVSVIINCAFISDVVFHTGNPVFMTQVCAPWGSRGWEHCSRLQAQHRHLQMPPTRGWASGDGRDSAKIRPGADPPLGPSLYPAG